MLIIVQVLVGVVCLAMFGLGMTSMLAPGRMIRNFAIEPQGPAGFNTIRGVIGGLFIASLAMLIAGLVTGQTMWFLAVGLILASVAAGRIIGLVSDGFDRSVVPPLILEVVMVVILVFAHTQLR